MTRRDSEYARCREGDNPVELLSIYDVHSRRMTGKWCSLADFPLTRAVKNGSSISSSMLSVPKHAPTFARALIAWRNIASGSHSIVVGG